MQNCKELIYANIKDCAYSAIEREIHETMDAGRFDLIIYIRDKFEHPVIDRLYSLTTLL